MTQLPKETQKNGGHKQIFLANHLASTDNLTRTTKRQKRKLKIHKKGALINNNAIIITHAKI